MQDQIPTGTQVTVLSTVKGEIQKLVGEVLAYVDEHLVHVNIDGEAVSVHPSQVQEIVPPAPDAAADPAQPNDKSTAPAASVEPSGEVTQTNADDAATDAKSA